VGLIYEWKKGDIDWVKDFMDRRSALLKQKKWRDQRLESAS